MMPAVLAEAPQLLIALEQSGLATAIRQSTWAYPAANVGHILALTVFAGAVTVMDARLLGAFAAAPPASVVRPARRAAMLGLLLMAGHGLRAVRRRGEPCRHEPGVPDQDGSGRPRRAQCRAGWRVRSLPRSTACRPSRRMPARIRLAAFASLAIWLSVAACGR